MSDGNDILMGGGGTPSISWKGQPAGYKLSGPIVRIGEARQATEIGGTKPRVWDDGQPVMQVPIEWKVESLRDVADPDDEGVRTLWVQQSSDLQKAIAKGVRAAKAKNLEVGGVLTVEITGYEPTKFGSDKRLFSASWTPSGASFFDTPAAPPAPAAPAVDVSALTPEQIAAVQALQGNTTPPF